MSEARTRWSWADTPLTVKAVLLLLSVLLVVGTLGYWLFAPQFDRAFDEEASRRGLSMVKILEQHSDVRQALLRKDRDVGDAVARRVLRGDTSCRYVMLLDANGRDIWGLALGSAEGAEESEFSQEAINRIQANLAEGRSADGAIQRFVRTVARAPEEFDGDARPAGPAGDALGKVILGLSTSSAKRSLAQLTGLLIGAVGSALLLAFLVFFQFTRRRLITTTRFAERMARGDLTRQLVKGGGDEIGRLVNAMIELRDRMGSMVARLQDAARALTDASSEILSSSSQQSQAAARQAASVTETGATLAQLKEIFAQAAERAQSVIDLAEKSQDSTTSGRTAVQESVQAMEQIRDEVTHIASTILGLVERTDQIASIIGTVNDLAEQSNVLALNAAIEAARAGEHGKGFAVVAREVRSLAKRSKDATGQVRLILQDIEKAGRASMAVIEQGTRKTQNGMELATRAGQSIVVLDQAIDASSTAAKQIAASIRQQSAGIEQIWEAMRDVDRAVQDNATGIRQLESYSKTMKTLSEQMGELTAAYQVSR